MVSNTGVKAVTRMYINHLEEYLTPEDLSVIPSPLLTKSWPVCVSFVGKDEYLLGSQIVNGLDENESKALNEFLRPGPRKEVVFEGKKVKAAIVTCGGLCPGLNTVIREIVMALTKTYGPSYYAINAFLT